MDELVYPKIQNSLIRITNHSVELPVWYKISFIFLMNSWRNTFCIVYYVHAKSL